MARARRKVLAIASPGGHFVQLTRLLPAFEGMDLVLASTHPDYAKAAPQARFVLVPDATRWDKLGLIKLAWKILWLLARERPDVVISTGAAPGYFALRMGKWFRARTVWVDSIANVEELSLSGARVGPHADLWLTQWEHLARPQGPEYRGSVL
jgi:exopolysaccharide biosynthesis glucuronosyltransferase PssD